MMMMTSIDSVKLSLETGLKRIRTTQIADAVLADTPTSNNEIKNDSNASDAYNYAATKLAVIKQKSEQKNILKTMLAELELTGDVSKETLKKSQEIKGKENTNSGFVRNDDGAPDVTQTYAEVAKSGGIDKLIDASTTEISKATKQKLAGEYLAKMQEIEKITNDSVIPTDLNSNAVTPNEVVKTYAEKKKVYIKALKEAKEKSIIEFTEGKTTEVEIEETKGNKKFDPDFKVVSGEDSFGVDANKNEIAKRLKLLRDELEGTRIKAKAAGLDDLDALLDEKTGEPPTSGLKLSSNFIGAKFVEVFGSQDATKKNLLPAALLIQKELQTLKDKDGNSKGLTLASFDKLLEDQKFVQNIEDIYSRTGKPIPTTEALLNTEAGIGPTSQEGNAPNEISKEVEGASDANREKALKNIKPIRINTSRDLGGKSLMELTLADGKPFNVKIDGNDTVVKNADGENAIIEFRGQPGVLLKRNNKYFIRFYDRLPAGAGNVVTTGIAQVDPKQVFSDPEFKHPKTEIEPSMLQPDSEKRTVIDYYVRAYYKDNKTDNSKVLYVARNFSDSIDRLKAIHAAQFFLKMEADPIAFPKKETTEKTDIEENTGLTIAGEKKKTKVDADDTPVSFKKS